MQVVWVSAVVAGREVVAEVGQREDREAMVGIGFDWWGWHCWAF